jgi:succinate dehydrogenase/fumarate reductase flavoprotein subunit
MEEKLDVIIIIGGGVAGPGAAGGTAEEPGRVTSHG